MRLRHLVVIGLCLLLAGGVFAQSKGLKAGDPAPAVEIAEWVRGLPKDMKFSLEPGTIYVVYFWKTDCGRCVEPLEYLHNEVQRPYGAKGLMTVAITTEDAKDVDRWLRSKSYEYREYAAAIGIDNRGRTDSEWRNKAGFSREPALFIVDRQARIAWFGDPSRDRDRMEQILERVLRGRYDATLEPQSVPLLRAARTARKARNWRLALQHYDEVIKLSPTVFADISLEKFQMILLDIGERDKAYAYARDELVRNQYAGDQDALRTIAEWVASSPKLTAEQRDLDLALEAATKARELAGNASPEAAASLALVHFHRGEYDKAVRLQRRAYMLAAPFDKPSYKRVLRTYQNSERASLK